MNVSRFTSTPPSPGRSRPVPKPRDQLEEADRLRQQGKLDRAESICFTLVRRHPNYVAALHTLGLVYLDKRDFERALDCLVRASMLDPKNWMTLTALSLAYLRLGANEMAAETLRSALAIRPQEASIFASLGEIHRDDCEYEAAEQAYQQARTLDPGLETAAVGIAICLSARGQSAEAASVLHEAFKRGHRSLSLLHAMSMLPPASASEGLLVALDRFAAGQSEPDAEFENTIAFARAAALDKEGRHAEAWQQLVAANRPLAAAAQGDLKENVARREKTMGRLRDASFLPVALSSNLPISLFILGPSRSGKTSLERLVATLDGVKAGCEVPIVENAVRRTFQAAAMPSSNYLEELPPDLLSSFRENYIEDLRRRAGSARVFTSTLPGRIHDARILASTVPNVRFLLMKRNSEDVCLRIYMTKYLQGNSFAYELRSIRDYLTWYDAMIDLTVEKLPQVARVVSYETLIDNPEDELWQAKNLCGLSSAGIPLLTQGNDRGCSAPYREWMQK